MSSLPVYILTSAQTFSAAEAFAYCLQSRKRATVIGEVTGGGAHRVTVRQWPKWGVGLSLPNTRPINPITKTDWEGTGVKPDIETEAAEALRIAHLEAVKALLAQEQDPEKKKALERVRADLEDH